MYSVRGAGKFEVGITLLGDSFNVEEFNDYGVDVVAWFASEEEAREYCKNTYNVVGIKIYNAN